MEKLPSVRHAAILLTVSLLLTLIPGLAAAQTKQRAQPRTLPNVEPARMIRGPDNNIWFIETGAIGRVAPSGVITSFAIPRHANDHPKDLTVGPDGEIWFTLPNDVGRISRNGKVDLVVSFPGKGELTAIINGPNRELWVIAGDTRGHALFSVTPGGAIAPVPVDKVIDPRDMIASYDGTVWFVEAQDNPAFATDPMIGQITATGHVRLYPVTRRSLFGPTLDPCDPGWCTPLGFTQTPDGAIWFPMLAFTIGRITPKGHVSGFVLKPMPGQPVNPCLRGVPILITHDRQGHIWYGQMTYACIGRLTPKGVIIYDVSPKRIDNVSGLVADARGNIWFALQCVNSLGRLTATGHVTIFHIPHTALDAGEGCPVTL